jgi:hypothetical protein
VRPAAGALGTLLRYVGGDPVPIRQAYARCAATPNGSA